MLLLFENLDLTPIHSTLWKDLHTKMNRKTLLHDTIQLK
jgi:hypothetical protein